MRKIFSILLSLIFFLSTLTSVFAQEAEESGSRSEAVELNGDVVEYSLDGNVITASGNVVVEHPQATLLCDEVRFDRLNNKASAKGSVRLITEQGEISARELTFDFNTMQGEFHHANIYADPYYGAARRVKRVSDSKIVMEDGYVTTSDFDKPEYRIASSKIEIYPGDKLLAKHNVVKAGPIPLAYIPFYWQNLKDEEPRFQFTPGFDKDWGIFLLTTYRLFVNERLRAVLHVDSRELLGMAYGLDVDYKTENFGDGVLKTYWTRQGRLTSARVGEEEPLSERDGEERYKVEWRHKWNIDDKTSAIMQFYKLSDRDFLHDFFENEFDRDQNPPTFFVLSRALSLGTFSLRTDKRVNRFVSTTEKIPEARYDLSNVEIGETGFYYSNFTTATAFSQVSAAPSDERTDVNRIHSDQKVSRPFKLSIFEVNPFVGREWTFYSRYLDRSKDREVREYFKAGASVQTKFYRIYDVDTTFLGEEINRLRHIITPSVTYNISKDPTIENSRVIQIDSIDSRSRRNVVNVALENKLQTKRGDKSVDLIRAIISSDYVLKSADGNDGFEIVRADVDIRPTDWLTFFYDSSYDLERKKFDTANFDIYINSGSKWAAGISTRLNEDVNDQITTNFKYMINPKWKFRMLHRINTDEGVIEEQQYVLTRDLHAWEIDFHIDDDREGSEFLVVFRLKAFPEIGFDFGTSFNERESGSE